MSAMDTNQLLQTATASERAEVTAGPLPVGTVPVGEGISGSGSTVAKGNGGGRKRKRNGPGKNFNNSKRQKNKQQNIIICGGGGNLSSSKAVIANANSSLGNNNNCSKSNAENYGNNTNNNGGGGRNKNFYHKIHFRNLNGGGGGGGSRSRRLQLFPALSKFFLPDKRPRKEIIVPPTKFLLGGNISDPLNLNSLQDNDVEASPKSSPMMTPPKVEVIIPPNIRDPLHLLDPVDSIEYEKQLTSPMKKMMGGKKSNKKKNRSRGRNSFPGTSSTVAVKNVDGGAGDAGRNVEEKLQETGVEAGVRDSLKLELVVDVELPERKRRISENSIQTSGGCSKPKVRRMDSIVSPVIPQPGAHKRPPPMGPQGAPHRNRQRTYSVQSADNDDLQVGKSSAADEGNEALKGENKEETEANRSTDSVRSNTTGSGVSESGDPIKETRTSGGGAGVEGCSSKAPGGSATKQASNKRKSKTAIFQFGNYDRYYGYRNMNEMMDVRLKVFHQNEFLFKDKDILDIGCNVGHLTTAVAKSFQPKSVVGIDIDPKLIRRAKENVSLYVRVPPAETQVSSVVAPGSSTGATGGSAKSGDSKSTNKRRKKAKGLSLLGEKKFAEFFPQSFPLCYGLIPDVPPPSASPSSMSSNVGGSSMTPTSGSILVPVGPKSSEDQPADAPKTEKVVRSERLLFPKNIRFFANNYVLRSEQQLANDERHKYDLIMCLSVTKWVHLNYGDAGLKMMFRRIFNQLRPGGKLILEAQNWASYKKKKKLTDRIFRNFQQIEFYPSQFHEYLLSPEVGFSHSYPLGVPRHLSKGFRRPIQLYIKGDYTPSQVMWSEAHHPPQTPYTPYRGIYAEMVCPPPRYNPNSSIWGGGDNTPFRTMASTSQYYNPLETDSYLPSYETEVSNRRYCFQSPLYSSEWSPPPLSSSNSETRTPPKPSTWSVSTTPVTPSRAMQGGGSVTNTPHHRHVYPPDETLLDLENVDSDEQPSAQTNGAGDTPRTEEDSPEH